MIAMKQPQTMMFGSSNGRMTFAPQRTVRSRGGINTPQHQYYNVNGTHAIAQSLPPIPSNQPMINHIPVRDVDLSDNYYHNYQQVSHTQPIIHTHTHPYISDTPISQQSDNNPPLSQYDNVNVNLNLNRNNNNNNNNNNNLKFSQSALPTITHLPPKLHHELPDPEEEETEQDDDAPLQPLYDDLSPHPLVLDGTSEQEIKKLHYFYMHQHLV